MSGKRDDGGPAFTVEGMGLRDYFAGQALIGLSIAVSTPDGEKSILKLMKESYPAKDGADMLALLAYRQADALLVERAK